MGYIRNTSSIIPGWDIKRNSADMKELAVMLKNQTSPNIATILTTFELCRQIFLVK